MTPPGDLNRRLVLEGPVEAADGAGGVARSYAPVMTLWGKVEPVSARGAIVSDAPGSDLGGLVQLAGDRLLVAGEGILVSSADHSIPVY